jgi:hypothetical protein
MHTTRVHNNLVIEIFQTTLLMLLKRMEHLSFGILYHLKIFVEYFDLFVHLSL